MANDDTVERGRAALEGDTAISGVTLATPSGSGAPTSGAYLSMDSIPRHQRFSERYIAGAKLGRGGMGEVIELRDRRIGRRIAQKVVLPAEEAHVEVLQRFMREARLQGQLEHPAIVPVYDFGRDDEGRLYFTMKRVDGVTLREVLQGTLEGDAEILRRFSRRKLLSAFVTACQAIDYAHSRGVIHRDLKPPNIMLGRFGEVYVLDWGIAKLAGSADEAPVSEPVQGSEFTQAGAFLGTVGYAAPEQLSCKPVDARADVYALGAILFELLALRPLHEGAKGDRIQSTVLGADVQALARESGKEIPPELLAICARATRSEPSERFASVRALYEQVEAFLEGESNLQVRRELAMGHAAHAAELARRALADKGTIEERRRAMEEAGRCLALDPTNERASTTLVSLMTTAPAETPQEVIDELERAGWEERTKVASVAVAAYLGFLLFLPMLIWQGIRDWVPIAVIFVGFALCGLVAAATRQKATRARLAVALTLSNTVGGVASALFGSLILVPAVVSANTLAYVMTLPRRHRWIALTTGTLAILIPFGLELAGVVSPPYAFEGGTMTLLPRAVSLPEVPTLTVLALTGMSCVITGLVATARVRDQLTEARTQLYLQGWHLRALFPGAKSSGS